MENIESNVGRIVEKKETGLDHDYLTAWMMPLIIARSEAKERLHEIEPVQHHDEYFEGKGYSPAIAEKEAVEAIDALVDEFNADLPRIKEKRDWKTFVKFCEKVMKMVRG